MRTLILPAAVLFFPLLALADTPDRAPIYLAVGEQRLINVPDLKRYSLGSDAVRALPDKGSDEGILIKGVHPGLADLWVWKSDGSQEHRQIRVTQVSDESLDPGLARALGQLNEVEVHFAGGGIVLRGEVASLREAAAIEAIVTTYPKQVHDETEPSDPFLDQSEEKLRNWLKKSAYSNRLELQRQDKTLWLSLKHGSLDDPREKDLLERKIHAIYPFALLQIDTLPDTAPTVHFKVFLLELQKTRFGSFGLGWPATQEGAFRVTTSAITNMLQLDLTLQELEGEGSAKILSNPELVVRAPGEAELFSGGELPIEMQSRFYSDVVWKNFGLTLKLNVTHSAGNRVRLDIFTEVSRLDPSLAGHTQSQLPGIQSSRMKTQVDAVYGRPLLLSGLLQQGTRQNAQGLPILRDIPVLGALFGSEDYQKDRSELVAILVPSAELPENPMERIERVLPKGPIPPPRSPANPAKDRELLNSPDYPWNAF
jgi:Flp pilus assembly secretin CpaC